ncbi:MAG: hypothetical protein RL095_1048 [Verrucomicrobiota bacterium]|jgi:hypothetical protein
MSTNEKVWGLVSRFDNPTDILAAAEKVRAQGYKKIDVHSPFPIHGIEKAIGVKATPLPWISLLGGTAGCLGAWYFQYWTTLDYPMIISGKPGLLHSTPAWFVVVFCVTILLCAFATLGGFMVLNDFPKYYSPLHKVKGFNRASDDQFFLVVSAADPQFDQRKTRDFLAQIGGQDVTVVTD